MHRLTPLLLLLSVLACVSGVTPTRGGTTTTAREEIAAMMARAASAWTRGDLDGFMGAYLVRGDSTTARGPTSLLIERVNGRWLIVHDHSS